jgi:hypothetical protein
LPLSPAGSGHPPHRFITPSRIRALGAAMVMLMALP